MKNGGKRYPPWLHSECEVVFSEVLLSTVVSKWEAWGQAGGYSEAWKKGEYDGIDQSSSRITRPRPLKTG